MGAGRTFRRWRDLGGRAATVVGQEVAGDVERGGLLAAFERAIGEQGVQERLAERAGDVRAALGPVGDRRGRAGGGNRAGESGRSRSLAVVARDLRRERRPPRRRAAPARRVLPAGRRARRPPGLRGGRNTPTGIAWPAASTASGRSAARCRPRCCSSASADAGPRAGAPPARPTLAHRDQAGRLELAQVAGDVEGATPTRAAQRQRRPAHKASTPRAGGGRPAAAARSALLPGLRPGAKCCGRTCACAKCLCRTRAGRDHVAWPARRFRPLASPTAEPHLPAAHRPRGAPRRPRPGGAARGARAAAPRREDAPTRRSPCRAGARPVAPPLPPTRLPPTRLVVAAAYHRTADAPGADEALAHLLAPPHPKPDAPRRGPRSSSRL